MDYERIRRASHTMHAEAVAMAGESERLIEVRIEELETELSDVRRARHEAGEIPDAADRPLHPCAGGRDHRRA